MTKPTQHYREWKAFTTPREELHLQHRQQPLLQQRWVKETVCILVTMHSWFLVPQKALNLGLKKFRVKIKGPGPGRQVSGCSRVSRSSHMQERASGVLRLFLSHGAVLFWSESLNQITEHGAVSFWSESSNQIAEHGAVSFWSESLNQIAEHGAVSFWSESLNQIAEHGAVSFWSESSNQIAEHGAVSFWSESLQNS